MKPTKTNNINHKTMENNIDFERLEKLGFYGIDACLVTSLCEYGLITRKKDETFEFIYVVEWLECDIPLRFNLVKMDEEEVDSILSWIDSDRVISFASNVINKVHYLLTYYGHSDIFWGGYCPLNEVELNNWIDNQ